MGGLADSCSLYAIVVPGRHPASGAGAVAPTHCDGYSALTLQLWFSGLAEVSDQVVEQIMVSAVHILQEEKLFIDE